MGWRRAALLLPLLLTALPLRAQPAIDAGLLGMSEADLQAALPALQRVARPAPGPRGMRGQWMLPQSRDGVLAWETVFYLKDKRLQRI